MDAGRVAATGRLSMRRPKIRNHTDIWPRRFGIEVRLTKLLPKSTRPFNSIRRDASLVVRAGEMSLAVGATDKRACPRRTGNPTGSQARYGMGPAWPRVLANETSRTARWPTFSGRLNSRPMPRLAAGRCRAVSSTGPAGPSLGDAASSA